jgi:PAS domain S-box-containing protein
MISDVNVTNSLFRQFLEALPDAFVALDENGLVVDWSAQAGVIFGWSAAQAIGQPVANLFFPGKRLAPFEQVVERLARADARTVHRLQAVHADGREMPVEVQLARMPVTDGRQIFLLIRDVSLRVLTEERLAHAEKMESIGQMTGGLAHDFNNILGIIIGSLEIVESRLRAPAQLELVRIAMQAAERGAEVSRAMQAVARRRPVQTQQADINVLIKEVEPLLRRTLTPAIDLLVVAEASMANADIDISSFNNALLNLVINARDAMPKGGRLMIYTQVMSVGDGENLDAVDLNPGPYIVLGVDDSGQGMTPEVMSRAVEPFFTTKPRGKGTGMGLAMAYAFARQSGGILRVRSEAGKGTSIHLFIPLLSPDLAKAGAGNTVGDQAGRPDGQGRILLVDDEVALLKIGEAWLVALGYEVRVANSAAGALELLAHEHFDLLISDVVMPGGMDGIALAEQALARVPNLRLIFATGYADREFPAALKQWPILGKPLRREHLVSAIATVFEQHPPAQSAR